MDYYGLTEQEKQTNLQEYNHALFQNMKGFMDACWEINLRTGTVVIIYDRIFPEYEGKQFEYERFFTQYAEHKIYQLDKEQWVSGLSVDNLRKLEAERTLDVHIMGKSGMPEIYRFIVTPARDGSGVNQRVYLSTKNVEEDMRIVRGREEELSGKLLVLNEELRRTLSREEQYRQAIISGAILVYNINVSQNLIEDEFYEMLGNERLPMLERVGCSAPCDFDAFAQLWAKANILEEDREGFLKIFNHENLMNCFLNGQTEIICEYHSKGGRGADLILQHTILLAKDGLSGEIIAFCSAKDVTRQRHREQETMMLLRNSVDVANRANHAKSDFLSRMSHDIRTPLNGIIGMTAIAETHLEDRVRVKDCLDKISLSSKHLMELLNEILDMSKIEAGKMDLSEEAFNLSALVDTLLNITKQSVEAKHHELKVNVCNLEHEWVIGDSLRIQQVFMNLLSNAVKYTPEGGRISLTISEKAARRPQIGCYEFIFEDNGIGMSPEFAECIFDPFSRAKDTRVNKIQGTGLGMSITKTIVDMMDGNIKVESELGVGSRFTVTIYLKIRGKEEDHEEAPEESAISQLQQMDLSGHRVLLVEDNELNAEIALELLNMLGLEVEHAENGKEAVDMVAAASEGHYDLVLMDIQMPVMNGNEATRAIRALPRKDVVKLPILAMTANAFAEDVQAVLSAGMNEHLAKPLDIKKMLDALSRWLPPKAKPQL